MTSTFRGAEPQFLPTASDQRQATRSDLFFNNSRSHKAKQWPTPGINVLRAAEHLLLRLVSVSALGLPDVLHTFFPGCFTLLLAFLTTREIFPDGAQGTHTRAT